MKKIIYILIFSAAFLWSCEKPVEEVNTAPQCKILAPEDGGIIANNAELLIKGIGSDAEDNIVSVSLKLNGNVISTVSEVPFRIFVKPEDLLDGENIITLQVRDAGGLSGEHIVKVTATEPTPLATSPATLEFGYNTEELELTVTTEGNWTMEIPEEPELSVYNDATGSWEKMTSVMGSGNKTLRIKCTANANFTDNTAEMLLATANSSLTVGVNQKASPDFFMFLEDGMLRMAAQNSMYIYGIDENMDWKLSAWEMEQEIEEGAPYGFDAGVWDVKSTKGIEYFPKLRHLDINRNPELKEIDLSGNPELLSIHVNGCTSLTNLDLTKVPKLIELGCDHALYTKLDLSPFKTQLHTLAVLNRTGGPSTIDVSGYSNLNRLYVNENGLTELNLSGCSSLWLLSASENDFTELDLSDVDRDEGNMYLINNCPNLKKVYVWQGFTTGYYNIFSIDPGVQIIEK